MRMPLPDSVADFLAYKVDRQGLERARPGAAKAGLRPEDVDFISFDHLHVQDVRFVLGHDRADGGRVRAAPAAVPEREADHPAPRVGHLRLDPPDAVGLVRRRRDQGRADRQRRPDRRRRRARQGCALVSTPGHTDGNHSLCINTPEGVWVSSENGVAADSWHPRALEDPGRASRTAAYFGREVILNSNTLEDSIDQYDSMIKEKALADPNPRDPRFRNVFPSSEMPTGSASGRCCRRSPTAASTTARSSGPRHTDQLSRSRRSRSRMALRRTAATLDGWTDAPGPCCSSSARSGARATCSSRSGSAISRRGWSPSCGSRSGRRSLLAIAARRGALRGFRPDRDAGRPSARCRSPGPFLLIAAGQQEITSSLAGILVTSAPLFTALLAIWIDQEERSQGAPAGGHRCSGVAGVVVLLGVDLGGSGRPAPRRARGRARRARLRGRRVLAKHRLAADAADRRRGLGRHGRHACCCPRPR